MRTSATVCLLGGIALWSWGCAGAPEPGAGRDERLAITGVVLNEAGRAPEAGVWVIAETRSLPVRHRTAGSPGSVWDSARPRPSSSVIL